MYSFTQSTLYSQNLIHKEKITHMWLLRLTTGKLYASPPPSALFTSGITNLFSTNVGFINVLSKRHYGIRILGFITTSGALRFIHSCQICFRNAMGPWGFQIFSNTVATWISESKCGECECSFTEHLSSQCLRHVLEFYHIIDHDFWLS